MFVESLLSAVCVLARCAYLFVAMETNIQKKTKKDNNNNNNNNDE